ncbi:hypothetical protein GCM10020001_114270 [Nonomuraea salmonea]
MTVSAVTPILVRSATTDYEPEPDKSQSRCSHSPAELDDHRRAPVVGGPGFPGYEHSGVPFTRP